MDRLILDGAHALQAQAHVHQLGDGLQDYVDGIVNPCHRQQIHEKHEEVDLSRHEQHSTHHDDGCDSQTQESLGGAHRHTHSQLGTNFLSLETIDAAIKLILECAHLVERAYLTVAFKVFLQRVGE